MTKEEQLYVKTLQNPYASLNFEEPVSYKTGTFFKVLFDSAYSLCILAQVDSYKVALIELQTGNRWTDPIEVDSPLKISKEIVDRLADGDQYEVMPASWQFV